MLENFDVSLSFISRRWFIRACKREYAHSFLVHSTDLSAMFFTQNPTRDSFFKYIIYKTNNEMEIDRGLVAASNSSFVCLFIYFLFKLNYMCTPDIVQVSQSIIPCSK